MFWDGERWIDERQLPESPPARAAFASRLRRWSAPAIALAVGAALVLAPSRPANAVAPATSLIQAWSEESTTDVIQERDASVSVRGDWNRVHKPAAMGDQWAARTFHLPSS